MIRTILENKDYNELVVSQVRDLLMLMVDITDNFSITVNINGVSFDPQLPEVISENFAQYTLFSLANFTFESIILNDNYISFEAGFGAENFGSVVTVPYSAIFQIILDESILFINPTATMERKIEINTNNKNVSNEQEKRSRNAFTMNPKNKGLV